MNRIFTIQGGYATVRNCLRKRGWVENFFRATEVVKKPPPKFKSDIFGWLGFTACQPIGSFYAEYVFIYELTLFFYEQLFTNSSSGLFNP